MTFRIPRFGCRCGIAVVHLGVILGMALYLPLFMRTAVAEEPEEAAPAEEILTYRNNERLAKFEADGEGNLRSTYDGEVALTVSGNVAEVDWPLVRSPSIEVDSTARITFDPAIELKGQPRSEILFVFGEHSFWGDAPQEGDRMRFSFDEEGNLIDAINEKNLVQP